MTTLVNSADSHVVEPLDLWVQRLPAHLRERAPRIEEVDGRWLFLVEGSPPRRMGPPTEEAKKGRDEAEKGSADADKKSTGFRAGGSDPDVRAKDLDEDGVWGEVLYPTIALFGFVIPDPELRWATARAYNDWLAETFTAVRGSGAFLNGAPVRTTHLGDLTRALVGTGFGYTPKRRTLQAAALAHIVPRVRDIRRAGSAAIDLAWVAGGRLDGFYEAGIRDWDRAAGLLLVAEAGGRTGILDPGLDGADCVVAAGASLYDPLCALVRSGLQAARAEADRLH